MYYSVCDRFMMISGDGDNIVCLNNLYCFVTEFTHFLRLLRITLGGDCGGGSFLPLAAAPFLDFQDFFAWTIASLYVRPPCLYIDWTCFIQAEGILY